MTLLDLAGSQWDGQAELWLDPAGDQAQRCACTMRVEADAVGYTWSYQGQPQTGRLSLRDDGGDFTDSWHSPKAIRCTAAPAPCCVALRPYPNPTPDGPACGAGADIPLEKRTR